MKYFYILLAFRYKENYLTFVYSVLIKGLHFHVNTLRFIYQRATALNLQFKYSQHFRNEEYITRRKCIKYIKLYA